MGNSQLRCQSVNLQPSATVCNRKQPRQLPRKSPLELGVNCLSLFLLRGSDTLPVRGFMAESVGQNGTSQGPEGGRVRVAKGGAANWRLERRFPLACLLLGFRWQNCAAVAKHWPHIGPGPSGPTRTSHGATSHAALPLFALRLGPEQSVQSQSRCPRARRSPTIAGGDYSGHPRPPLRRPRQQRQHLG